MAEEVVKRKPGRPKKSETTTTKAKEPVAKAQDNTQNDIIAQLMKQIEEQNKKMAELQAQICEKQAQPIVSQEKDDYETKKIKVINLLNHPLILSTEAYGRGKKFAFEKFGDSRLIRYDDLYEILTSCSKAIRNGYCYIADAKAVEMLDLEEEYKTIVAPDVMKMMPYLREEYLVDIFVTMDDKLKESYAYEIAKKLNNNERIDLNYLGRIKEEAGIDIQEIARDLKDLQRKPDEE